MNKLIKLIYVNILDLGDINRVQMSKQAAVKDSSELKLVILSIIAVTFGIGLYYIYNFLGSFILNKVNNKINKFSITTNNTIFAYPFIINFSIYSLFIIF